MSQALLRVSLQAGPPLPGSPAFLHSPCPPPPSRWSCGWGKRERTAGRDFLFTNPRGRSSDNPETDRQQEPQGEPAESQRELPHTSWQNMFCQFQSPYVSSTDLARMLWGSMTLQVHCVFGEREREGERGQGLVGVITCFQILLTRLGPRTLCTWTNLSSDSLPPQKGLHAHP